MTLSAAVAVVGFIYPVPNSSTLLPSYPTGTPALVRRTTDGRQYEHAYSNWSKKKPAED